MGGSVHRPHAYPGQAVLTRVVLLATMATPVLSRQQEQPALCSGLSPRDGQPCLRASPCKVQRRAKTYIMPEHENMHFGMLQMLTSSCRRF